MYTAHQIDCLKQLGIEFLSTHQTPKRPELSQAVSVNSEPDIELASSFKKDLEVLFPTLEVTGSIIKLTDTFKWRIQMTSSRIIATKTQLITSSPELLSSKDWRQVWNHLAEHVTS